MLKQDFSTKSLLNITTLNEIIKFDMGRNKDDYNEFLNNCSNEIVSNDFSLDFILNTKIKGKTVYSINEPSGYYALKKISKDLKRLYKISTQNRDDISEQVLRILETSSNYGIVRLDVKDFYESIKLSDMLKKIKNDNLLSSKSFYLIDCLKELNSKGLPRGLSVSPVLSEIFMRNIDVRIKEISGVYYYSRYVDDIFVLSTLSSKSIYDEIKNIFSYYNLKTNHKTFISDISSTNVKEKVMISFDYLGYKYQIYNKEYKSKRIVNVVLSNDKVRKIKTRIVHSLLDRVLNSENDKVKSKVLMDRLKILSGNYPITSVNDDHEVLKGGVFYSNRLVNKAGVFEEFNTFLKKSIYTKKDNFFGNTVRKIPKNEIQAISSICFKEGFIEKKYYEYSDKEMKVIKSCWANKNYKKKNNGK